MSTEPHPPEPGLIVLFGSGETSPTGRKIFEGIFHSLPSTPRLALLETPAGFELNSSQVIGRVGDFFTRRLQNHAPRVVVIPARKRGSEFSPDNPLIVEPILHADLIFMGPGSPSYAVRQLRESLAWHYIVARNRLGAVLALASAATVALSAFALPVYEIYKAGEDLHWIEGLDFFKNYGLKLVFVPHWNNNEGGVELDTSRCFMGKDRFDQLLNLLPQEVAIIGLDEKTALIMDPPKRMCWVRGLGKVTLLHAHQGHHSVGNSLHERHLAMEPSKNDNLNFFSGKHRGHMHQYSDGQSFPMSEIGPFHTTSPDSALPPAVWQKALQAHRADVQETNETPPKEVLLLIQERQQARKMKDWPCADELRNKVANLGWQIMDTEDGSILKKIVS